MSYTQNDIFEKTTGVNVMTEKKIIGDAGEEFAESILIDKGYLVLVRNFSCKTGEIDIIAKDGDTFVFVEVKTRKNNLYRR